MRVHVGPTGDSSDPIVHTSNTVTIAVISTPVTETRPLEDNLTFTVTDALDTKFGLSVIEIGGVGGTGSNYIVDHFFIEKISE